MLLTVGFPRSARAAKPDSSSTSDGLVVLPFAFYTPETQLALGAGGIYYFREPGSAAVSKPSRLAATGFYTTKNQYRIELSPKLYLQNEKYFFSANITFGKWPDHFNGIGGNTQSADEEHFTSSFFEVQLNAQRSIHESIRTGLIYRYRNNSISEVEPGRLLDRQLVRGATGSRLSGIGFTINRDTRDNLFNPQSGALMEARAVFFMQAIGSEYDFNEYHLDYRRYHSIDQYATFAFMLYAHFAKGHPPFEELAQLGGRKIMRGYYEGRYRDEDYVTAQVEFRIPVWWRIGVVGFAGFGDVADDINSFRMEDFKISYGGGLRFMLIEEERLNLRLDFGFGGSSSGIYANIAEAF